MPDNFKLLVIYEGKLAVLDLTTQDAPRALSGAMPPLMFFTSLSADGTHLAYGSGASGVSVLDIDWNGGSFTQAATIPGEASSVSFDGNDLLVTTATGVRRYTFAGSAVTQSAAATLSLPKGASVLHWASQ